MTSRTDIQTYLGRTVAESLRIGNQPVNVGDWVEIPATISGGVLGTGGSRLVRYTLVGKTCHAQYVLSQTATTGGAATGTLLVTLPFPAKANNSCNGSGILSSTTDPLVVLATTQVSTTVFALAGVTAAAGPSLVSNAAFSMQGSASWAASFSITYEIA